MIYNEDENIVYTTIDDVFLNDGYICKSYKYLNLGLQAWAESHTLELMNRSTNAEKKFSSILEEMNYDFYEQAFFKINDKCYFLDFYIPSMNIAFEINGGIHKYSMWEDSKRDADFNRIGIKTIRLTNREVYLPNIKEIIKTSISKAYEGLWDVTSYYRTAMANKFDDKLTINQKFLLSAIDGIKNVKDNSTVLIKSTASYLLPVLNHLKEENINYYENKELIICFYKIVSSKNIKYDIIFDGTRKNIRGRLKHFINKLYKSPIVKVHDVVIKINGDSIKQYSNLKYSELLERLKNDEYYCE